MLFTHDGHVLMFNETGIATFLVDGVAGIVAETLNEARLFTGPLTDKLWDVTAVDGTSIVHLFLDGSGE